MSVFDIFKPSTPAPAASPNANASPNINENQTVPNSSNTPAKTGLDSPNSTGNKPADAPLANYEKLWENDPNKKPETPFAFNSDPAKLMEVAKTVDFTKVLTPELQAKINAGGADGQRASIEAMNMVAQLTYAQAAHASSKLVESAIQASEDRFRSMLPDIIKQHAVNDSLRTTNPLITNPAMAPMIHALQHQFTQKYPTATAEDIKNHVNDYLNGAADLIVQGRPAPAGTKPTKQSMDWSKFLE